MKKMLNNHKDFKKEIYTGQYPNGQLAVFIHDLKEKVPENLMQL